MSETKYVTRTANALIVQDAGTGFFLRLNPPIAQGVDKDDRIGWTIKYKYIQLRFYAFFTANAGGNAVACPCRILLFQPRQIPNAPPTQLPAGGGIPDPVPADVWNDSTNQYQTFVSSIMNQNVRIIADRTYNTGVIPNADAGILPSAFKFKKKVRVNNNVSFKSGGATYPMDPKDFYYVAVTCPVAANTVNINYLYHFRMSFTDI